MDYTTARITEALADDRNGKEFRTQLEIKHGLRQWYQRKAIERAFAARIASERNLTLLQDLAIWFAVGVIACLSFAWFSAPASAAAPIQLHEKRAELATDHFNKCRKVFARRLDDGVTSPAVLAIAVRASCSEILILAVLEEEHHRHPGLYYSRSSADLMKRSRELQQVLNGTTPSYDAEIMLILKSRSLKRRAKAIGSRPLKKGEKLGEIDGAIVKDNLAAQLVDNMWETIDKLFWQMMRIRPLDNAIPPVPPQKPMMASK